MPFEPGRSGNPAGGPVGSRHRQQLNSEFIAALLRDFRHGGPKAIERVRRTQPAAYMKILALLVPREIKVDHTNPVEGLSDERLADMIAELEERIARRAAGDKAKVIEGMVEPMAVETTAPPAELEPPNASGQTGCLSTWTPPSDRRSAGRGSARCHRHRACDLRSVEA